LVHETAVFQHTAASFLQVAGYGFKV